MKYAQTYIEAHRNTESINSPFQFPKFRLAIGILPCPFTTQAYAQGAKWKKLLIHWNENQEKTASIAFRFLRPKLSRESCFTHFLNYRELCKESCTKKVTTDITSPIDTGCKLNVHKTFRRRPGRLNVRSIYVLCLRDPTQSTF